MKYRFYNRLVCFHIPLFKAGVTSFQGWSVYFMNPQFRHAIVTWSCVSLTWPLRCGPSAPCNSRSAGSCRATCPDMSLCNVLRPAPACCDSIALSPHSASALGSLGSFQVPPALPIGFCTGCFPAKITCLVQDFLQKLIYFKFLLGTVFIYFKQQIQEVNDVKEIYFGQFRTKHYFIICNILLNQQ